MTPERRLVPGRFDDRKAVVVGVGSSIGRACADRLVGEGADVLVVDPDPDVVVAFCASVDGHVEGFAGAFASEADAAAVAARCEQRWDRVDVLIDCGAAMELWPLAEDAMDRWQEVIAVNLIGPAIYTLALEDLLRRSGSGSVVYLGSIDGILGNPNVPAYSIAKGGLVPLTHTMAQRLGDDGVRVNCVASAGVVQTSEADGPPRRHVGDPDLVRRLTPLGRMPDVDEIASVMLFYASADASYVSGTVLPVDGGRLAATPGTY